MIRPGTPRRSACAWSTGAAAVLVVGAAAAFAAAGHRTLPPSAFEYGVVRSFDGFVVADPYPSLITPRGSGSTRYLLVGPGKSGADEIVRGAVDRRAALEGTLVYRDGQAMIEVAPGTVAPGAVAPSTAPEPSAANSIAVANAAPDSVAVANAAPDSIAVADATLGQPAPAFGPLVELGERRLEGEIVGAKCHLGVMNPGSGLVHRSCAALCLRGGVPPLLAVRRADGSTEGIVLTGPLGEAVGRRVARLAGTPVSATGRLVRQGTTTFFRVDPTQIRSMR